MTNYPDFAPDVDYLVQGEWELSFIEEDGGIIVQLTERFGNRMFQGIGTNVKEAMEELKSQLPSPEFQFE